MPVPRMRGGGRHAVVKIGARPAYHPRMKKSTKIVKELKARRWRTAAMGAFTEVKKGPVLALISDATVSFRVEGREGANVWPMDRIVKERLFIVPEADVGNLTAEEKELREVVLEQTK